MGELKNYILMGCKAMHYFPSEGETDRILQKIMGRKDLKHPEAYAFAAGRNFAISKARKAKVAAIREYKREKAAAETKAEEKRWAEAEGEFLLWSELLIEQYRQKQPTIWDKMKAVYVLSFLRNETQKHFPGINRDTVYQWKRRGIKLLQPYVSQELWTILAKE